MNPLTFIFIFIIAPLPMYITPLLTEYNLPNILGEIFVHSFCRL